MIYHNQTYKTEMARQCVPVAKTPLCYRPDGPPTLLEKLVKNSSPLENNNFKPIRKLPCNYTLNPHKSQLAFFSWGAINNRFFNPNWNFDGNFNPH